jgi:rare lipoprotein A
VLGGLLLSACTVLPKGSVDMDLGTKQRGIASWYGEDFHGWLTANGEPYDMHEMTGAHRTLPFGTVVRVTNVENGRSALVRINDRGPYVNGRIIDLSYAAGRTLELLGAGVAAVQLEVVGQPGAPFLDGPMAVTVRVASTPVRQGDERRGPAREPGEVKRERGLPFQPGDLYRARRSRRVADILAAGNRLSDPPERALF